MTTRLKIVRTASDHDAALSRIGELIDAPAGTAEGDELEVLAKLIEEYEAATFPVELPSPVEAIRFRMEQQGLGPRDLEPILGSRARVSQVMNGTRPLSIDMIRAVHRHLGIPAEILIGSEESSEFAGKKQELSRAAASLLQKWGLLREGETLGAFVARAFGGTPAAAMYRKTRTPRTNAKTDQAALKAWCAAAMIRSREIALGTGFTRDRLDGHFLRGLAQLSRLPDGPVRAGEALAEAGVALVVLPHLPGTHLDGAAMMRDDGVPVIAMTLRRNRIDNFWFTLLHECIHVARHLDPGGMILDDLEIGSEDEVEQEADMEARQALIPESAWARFNSGSYCSLAQLLELADQVGVHPAIAAGRWQNHNRDFRKFSKLLGHGEVRRLFPETADL